MVPYIYPDSLVIVPGVLEFHSFGLLVGIAIVFGVLVAQRRAEKYGLSANVMADAGIFFVLVGFVFAHWVSVIFYFPERIVGTECTADFECGASGYYGIDFSSVGTLFAEGPGFLDAIFRGLGKLLGLLDRAPETFICQENGRCNDGSIWSLAIIWNGISSVGGFLGAFVGILIFFRVKRIPLIPWFITLEGGKGRPVLKYLDAAAYGMAFAWIFGRAACYTAHDHIGRLTTSPFGMRFPDDTWGERLKSTPEAIAMFGDVNYTQRFDLGFLEMMWAVVMSIIFFVVARKFKNLRPGWYGAVLMFCYGPYRVFLDSLRATDISHSDLRYNILGLNMTTAQIGAIIMFCLAALLWYLGGKAMKDPDYLDNSKFPMEGEDKIRNGTDAEPANEKA